MTIVSNSIMQRGREARYNQFLRTRTRSSPLSRRSRRSEWLRIFERERERIVSMAAAPFQKRPDVIYPGGKRLTEKRWTAVIFATSTTTCL